MARLQDDAKRWSIVEAAFRVFGAFGFRATTMKQIAREAGIAPGSIYTYFHDKEELFRTAVNEGWKDFLSVFHDIVRSPRPLQERIDVLVDTGFQKLKDSLPLLRGMLFEASHMPAFRENIERFCQHVVSLLEEGLEMGILELNRGGAWKKLVRVIVNGSMFSVALAPEGSTDSEIDDMKRAVKKLIRERIRKEARP